MSFDPWNLEEISAAAASAASMHEAASTASVHEQLLGLGHQRPAAGRQLLQPPWRTNEQQKRLQHLAQLQQQQQHAQLQQQPPEPDDQQQQQQQSGYDVYEQQQHQQKRPRVDDGSNEGCGRSSGCGGCGGSNQEGNGDGSGKKAKAKAKSYDNFRRTEAWRARPGKAEGRYGNRGGQLASWYTARERARREGTLPAFLRNNPKPEKVQKADD